MSINEKMTAIADAIRAKTGGTNALTLDGMAAAIPEVFAAGESAEAEKVAARQFVTALCGNDENTISIPIPFKPDLILISSFDAYSRKSASTYNAMMYDFRAAARSPVAFILYTNSKATASTTTVSNSNAKNLFTYAGGIFTFTAPSSTEYQLAKWRSELLYAVSAFKYTDKSDKELISEQISRLPDSGGTVEFASAAISAAFTDDEWASLIATKPNWTFTLA